jgi:hypothetical protein
MMATVSGPHILSGFSKFPSVKSIARATSRAFLGVFARYARLASCNQISACSFLVNVGVGVGGTGVAVLVGVGVSVLVAVGVGVRVGVDVRVAVGVGEGVKTLQAPRIKIERVRKIRLIVRFIVKSPRD